METLRLRTNEGRAKLVGTLLGAGGAFVLVFYKGVEIHIWSTHVDLLKNSNAGESSGEATTNHHLSVAGVLMVLGSNVCFSFWLILQASATFIFLLHIIPWLVNIFYTIDPTADHFGFRV